MWGRWPCDLYFLIILIMVPGNYFASPEPFWLSCKTARGMFMGLFFRRRVQRYGKNAENKIRMVYLFIGGQYVFVFPYCFKILLWDPFVIWRYHDYFIVPIDPALDFSIISQYNFRYWQYEMESTIVASGICLVFSCHLVCCEVILSGETLKCFLCDKHCFFY